MDVAAVVGLGNPGAKYAATRHNVGAQVVDELARRWRAGAWKRLYRSDVAKANNGLLLVRPRTYMNDSGEAVLALCSGARVQPSACLVVVDDVELPLGLLRLRANGGPGTHNGLRSIVGAVGAGFPRLRVGIRGEHPWDDLADYVLARFTAEERESVTATIARAADCVESMLRIGLGRTASLFNAAPAAPAEPS